MLSPGVIFTHVDDEGKKVVVAYVSCSNNSVESKYSTYKKEHLTTIWVVTHFRCYLYDNPFILTTNHQPIK